MADGVHLDEAIRSAEREVAIAERRLAWSRTRAAQGRASHRSIPEPAEPAERASGPLPHRSSSADSAVGRIQPPSSSRDMFSRASPEAAHVIHGCALAIGAHLLCESSSQPTQPSATEAIFADAASSFGLGEDGSMLAAAARALPPSAHSLHNLLLRLWARIDLDVTTLVTAYAYLELATTLRRPVSKAATAALRRDEAASLDERASEAGALPGAMRVPLTPLTWRGLLLCAIICAEKFGLDGAIWSWDVAAALFQDSGWTDFDVNALPHVQLAPLEIAFLDALDWRLNLSREDYARTFFTLTALSHMHAASDPDCQLDSRCVPAGHGARASATAHDLESTRRPSRYIRALDLAQVAIGTSEPVTRNKVHAGAAGSVTELREEHELQHFPRSPHQPHAHVRCAPQENRPSTRILGDCGTISASAAAYAAIAAAQHCYAGSSVTEEND
jgi:hypothetical protein